MKIDYESIIDTLQEELDKIKQYSRTVDIDKLENRIEQIQIDNTIYDNTEDNLSF